MGSIPTRSRHTRSAARASRLRRAIPLLAAFAALVLPAVTAAQARDSARSGVTPATPPPLLTPADTATTPEAGQSAAQRSAPPPARNAAYHPPISPKTAFFSSLLLPGLGQARLDRSYAGALFFVTEIVGAYRLRQALIDLSYAQKHSHDSTLVVQTYNQDSLGQPAFDSTGAPSPATFGYARYDSARIGARKTHVEDWEAALAFNHLISAADAFVAAQLWDLPAHIRPKMAMLDDGRMFYGATVYW